MSNPIQVSIAISAYEMSGMGRLYLRSGLESIVTQSVQNLEVVVTDDSETDEIAEECQSWSSRLKLRYFRHRARALTPSYKLNFSVDQCSGKIIKILCQDDVLIGRESLRRTIEAFSSGVMWVVSAYTHIDEVGREIGSHVPKLHPRIERVNTIGSHSGLAFLRDKQIERFDERLFWRMDCELYRRLFERYGPPEILLDPTVGVRQWRGQSTHSMIKRGRRVREWCYIARKYPRGLQLPDA